MPPSLKENLEIIAGMVAIFVLDVVAGAEISYGTAFTSSASQTIGIIDDIGAVIFVIITVLAIIAILINRRSVVLRIFVLYLIVATVQTVANIAALLVTAHVRNDNYLWGLFDIGAAYLMIVSVFTGWYWVSDRLIKNGAFVFPARDNQEPPQPNLIDYLFIAFNTNATFGPTSESVVSRRVKLIMMSQTTMSLVILLVLVARIIGLQRTG